MASNRFKQMRMAGWFDVLVKLSIIALIFALAALFGLISYDVTAQSFTPEMGDYERAQALNWFANVRAVLGIVALALAVFCALGFLWIAFVTPAINKDVRRQVRMRKANKILQTVVATLVSLIMLFPIYWMIVSSFKTSDELLLPTPTLWPENWYFQNYPNVLNRAPFGLYLYNTVVSTFFIMIFQLGIGILAAYGFSKGEFKGKNGLFLVVLGALMVPIQVTFVPIYVMISKLGWINTFAGLIVPNLVSAYFIFMLRQTFMGVDNSYLEAGKVDGCSDIGVFCHITVPLARPIMTTVALLVFANCWNEFLWANTFLTIDSTRTVATRFYNFVSEYSQNTAHIFTAGVISLAPIALLYLTLQDNFIEGITAGGVKG